MGLAVKNQKAYEFYVLVKEMRDVQKRWFQYHIPQDLNKSKELETKVDEIIEKVENIINPQPTQQTLNI